MGVRVGDSVDEMAGVVEGWSGTDSVACGRESAQPVDSKKDKRMNIQAIRFII